MADQRIDMHAHFYGGGLAEMLRARTERPCLRRRGDGTEVMLAMNGEFPFTPAHWDHGVGLARMREIGLTRRLLTFPGALCVDVLPAAEVARPILSFNDFLADLGTRTGGALVGLAGLPLADLDLAAAEILRIRRELRLPGVILPSNYFNSVAEARQLDPLFRAANAAGCLMMLHPGPRVGEVLPPPIDDHPQYRTSVIALQAQAAQTALTLILSDILDTYPRIRFQIITLGGTLPVSVERLESVARHRNPDAPFPTARLRNLWYDCASLGPRALEAAVRLYGADRIMMGSDYPIFHDDPWTHAVAPADLSDADRARIAWQTAADLLAGLEVDVPPGPI